MSEGFDAIAFLGPLSGAELYQPYYAHDVAAFAPRLPHKTLTDLKSLWSAAAADGVGLLGPNLQVIFSSAGNNADLDTIIAALDQKDSRLLPAYRASPYWSDKDWSWFAATAPRLRAIFVAMRQANFSRFRCEAVSGLVARATSVQDALGAYDVVRWQEKVTGRPFDPTIEVVLLAFAKPHGIKVQGQSFLQAHDYDLATTVRIAAHEMLHPPVDMHGLAASAALEVLGRDPLLTRIVREHDPKWGYTTLDGMLNEDLCEALDQLIGEALGVARDPAERWCKSDDGMHVLAGGLYGLLREDGWSTRGGSIEAWLADAVCDNRLAPQVLHAAAARVLKRSIDALWPLAASSGHAN